MEKRKERGKKSVYEEQPDNRGYDTRKDLTYGRGGPGGAQESRADSDISGGREEVLSQSRRGEAFERGTGQPETPIDVGVNPYDVEKTPGVPGGMSGMENEGNVGVHRGSSEYPALSQDEQDILGAKKGAAKKRKK